jgi:hypothetical protein
MLKYNFFMNEKNDFSKRDRDKDSKKENLLLILNFSRAEYLALLEKNSSNTNYLKEDDLKLLSYSSLVNMQINWETREQ